MTFVWRKHLESFIADGSQPLQQSTPNYPIQNLSDTVHYTRHENERNKFIPVQTGHDYLPLSIIRHPRLYASICLALMVVNNRVLMTFLDQTSDQHSMWYVYSHWVWVKQ